MKQVYKFDNQGRFVEPIVIFPTDGVYKIPSDCTDKSLPQPNWKPVFNGAKWEETITDEELATLKNQPQPKPEIELLKDENLELKLALAEMAETQQSDKTEMQLALAEIAEILLGGE